MVAVLTAGAGSAQAFNTTICTVSNLPLLTCSTPRPSGTVFKATASGTNAVQTSSGESLSCTGSTIEFETTATVGSPTLPAEVKSWPVSGCTDVARGISCGTVFFGPVPPYNMSIQSTGSDHGALKVTRSGNILFKYSCGPVGSTIVCVFETPVIELQTSSLTPAVASMSASMTLDAGSPTCGSVSKLVGSFTFTYPSPYNFFVEHD